MSTELALSLVLRSGADGGSARIAMEPDLSGGGLLEINAREAAKQKVAETSSSPGGNTFKEDKRAVG